MPLVSSKVLSFFTALPLVTTMLVSSAHADIYKLYVVAQTQSENFVMGDDFGDYALRSSVTFNNTNYCGTSYLESCYQVGNAIAATSYYSSTVPSPQADPNGLSGHANLPNGPGWNVSRTLGNLFAGEYDLNGINKRGIWDGPDLVNDYLSSGSLDGGFASGNGNVFFIDGLDNTLVVGVDVQTSPVPEPGTLSLTLTALLSGAAVGQRRLCS